VTEQEKLFTAAKIIALVGVTLVAAGFWGSITASLAERRGHLRRRWFWIAFCTVATMVLLLYFVLRDWYLLGLFSGLLPIAALFILPPGPNASRRRYTPGDRRRAMRAVVTVAAGSAGLAIGWILADSFAGAVWAVIVGATAGWITKLAMLDRSEQRHQTLRTAVVATAGGAGLILGWVLGGDVTRLRFSYQIPRDAVRSFEVAISQSGLASGVLWGLVGSIVAIVVLAVISVFTDPSEPDPDYEPSPDRPETPRRVATLVPALVVAGFGFTVGGIWGDAGAGVIWGIVAGAATIGALLVAGERPAAADLAIAGGAVMVSAILAHVVVPDLPEDLTPNLSLLMAAAWIPAGLGMAYLVGKKHRSGARGITTFLGWAGAGLLSLPFAVSTGLMAPISSLLKDAPLGPVPYWLIGLIVGVIGVAFTLSGFSGLNSLAALATIGFLTVYAAAQVGFTVLGLSDRFQATEVLRRNMWPPDFEWAIGTGEWWNITSWDFGSDRTNPLIETLRIAVIACLIGVTLAVPLALRASRITAIRGSDYWLNKGFMNVIRTIPDLFWAMIFATSVGIGPFAGTLALIFFSMAIMAKLLSETVDAVDPRPIEAARATGSAHWPAMRTSVWPQVLPNYVAYALYIFEINIRASVVLGIVGAGGIGRVLEAQRGFYQFDRVLAIVIVIFVIVFLIEQVSVALRRRLV
jgi:phosphonate transport system permease protein